MDRQLTNFYDPVDRRGQVPETADDTNIVSWQFIGPGRVAEVTLRNGLICTWMNTARTDSAVQTGVANPGWGDKMSDRHGYDGAGRPITKRDLAGGISDGLYADTTAVVGFTTEYDLGSNTFCERELHAESRSHLYEPFVSGVPQGGYDSLDRLRQYKRGVPMSPFAPAKVARSSRERKGTTGEMKPLFRGAKGDNGAGVSRPM